MPVYKKIDKSFFKKWSKNMAYVLGWLFADGNIINTKRGTWFWSIQITDKDVLSFIKNITKSEHIISVKKKIKGQKQLYRFQIGSKDMCEDLIKLGLTERKSKIMKFPVIPKIYFSDFLRGYFEGDGGVWVGFVNKNRKKKTHVLITTFTSGSKIFLESLDSELKILGIRGGSLVKKRDGFDLKYSVRDSLFLYKFMYNREVPFWLERKRGIFEKYIKNMRS